MRAIRIGFLRIFAGAVAVILVTATLSGCREKATPGLVVYTYEAFPEPLIALTKEHFSSEYSVEVDFRRFGDSGGVYAMLIAEREAPTADVAVGLDTTYLEALREAKLFDPYRSPQVGRLDESLVVDRSFLVTAFDYGGVTLNYDSESLETPPVSWNDLLDPSLARSIVVMNPATSSPGRNFLLHTILEFGPDRYLDFWRRLKPNILTITGSWYEGYGLYTEGEAPIVVSYETSPAYHIEFEATDRYRNIYLDGKAYGQIEIAGIVSRAPNRKNAERFIDFLLSDEFQREIPLNQFMYPATTGIPLPASFVDAMEARTLVQLSPADVSRNIEAWIEAWEEVMR